MDQGRTVGHGLSSLPLIQEMPWATIVIAEILAQTLIAELHKEKPKEMRELFRAS